MEQAEGGRAVGSGVILMIAGLALLWMGADLASGGMLTRLISGGAAAAAVAAAQPSGPRDVAA
jgi:hypothetical protein